MHAKTATRSKAAASHSMTTDAGEMRGAMAGLLLEVDGETARRCVRTIVSWGQRPAAAGQEQD